jgi:signal transduction histidine kinase
LGYNDSLLFDEATEATTTFGEWTGEMTHHRKSGAPIKVEGHWTLVRDDEGRPNAILSVNTDLTKRLEAEELALRSQRLEAIGQLTGGIAHDFNNLLTVILGNSEVLVEQLSADERLSSLASMIRMAAERGGDLTNHLLAFARRQALDPKALDVDELTRKMDGLLRRTLGEHIELEFASPDDLWKALADEAQLESAILNVCINARDAMPGGGRLVIETANVQLDQATVEGSQEDVRPGNYVMIAISDTGSGMSEEVLSRAFEPFFTTKEIGKGSGLGLSMVYGFAKQSGGSVRIASEIGRGTTVRLYLSRVDQPSESLPELPPKSIDMLTGTESILLVEDEDIVRRYAHQLLTSLGYKVSPVANGPEALAALRTTADYDLLFTDIVMPGGLDGWRLADEARRIRPHLKVLFTSGYTDKAAHPGLRRGTLLLNKPYKPHELATKIRVALSGAPKGVNG